MEHQLILEHRQGRYEAHCSCGAWRKEPIMLRLSQVRQVYPGMRYEHRQHVGAFGETPAETAASQAEA